MDPALAVSVPDYGSCQNVKCARFSIPHSYSGMDRMPFHPFCSQGQNEQNAANAFRTNHFYSKIVNKKTRPKIQQRGHRQRQPEVKIDIRSSLRMAKSKTRHVFLLRAYSLPAEILCSKKQILPRERLRSRAYTLVLEHKISKGKLSVRSYQTKHSSFFLFATKFFSSHPLNSEMKLTHIYFISNFQFCPSLGALQRILCSSRVFRLELNFFVNKLLSFNCSIENIDKTRNLAFKLHLKQLPTTASQIALLPHLLHVTTTG